MDATRWFMLSRSHESAVDLDLTLAKAQSSENPVYYVQYAHARIASMLRRAGEERVAAALARLARRAGRWSRPSASWSAACSPSRPRWRRPRSAARRTGSPPTRSSSRRSSRPSTATAASSGAEPAALESFRIALSVATQRVIARSLGLLGVSAPESM